MLDHFDHRADRHRPLLLVFTALRILAGATCVAPQHSGRFSIGAALDLSRGYCLRLGRSVEPCVTNNSLIGNRSFAAQQQLDAQAPFRHGRQDHYGLSSARRESADDQHRRRR
ncbi:hypothetical protein FHT39_003429 [Mitsuaria sp. BK045]|uniref:hypothetical protein n=1 Tax=unclassified Roseateles TaxID=2626991 RepID=UPI00160F73B7|nr:MULTISPECIES: hypothetical protein [unclassified Roseateles]MBB3294749.1 hypothetical protein [Mitsuaria sp. BK041]MBB3363965.1 hypothetical protein [Mitsuaria sp. BK045]